MWRPMTYQDLTEVFQLANKTWGAEYHESFESYKDKFEYYPLGCRVYGIHQVMGYAIWHPWSSTQPPQLNGILDRTTVCDSVFLHDIVMEDVLRGKGLSRIVIEECINSHAVVTLAAANKTIKTQHLWEHFGFIVTGINCDYGVHMKRSCV
jgi:hypothetical protein